MFVYLARPIDQAGESSWLGTLDMLIQRNLVTAGIGAFQPSRVYVADLSIPRHLEFIDEMNNIAIFNSDALVALLPAGVPTLGTPVEISAALLLNKPVLILTDIVHSVQLAAWAEQGATVIRLIDRDQLPESAELRAMLTRRPRPDEEAANQQGGALLVKYDKGATKLGRAHSTDAGLDLATLEDATLHYGERVLIPTGVYGSIPEGWYGRMTGRSSARTQWQVKVHEGIIDAGYTGELKLNVTYRGNLGHINIPAGTRLGQYILQPVWDGEVIEVDELPESARGDRGWGSSGA